MDELLQNPAVQAGVAPLLVALMVGAALSRTRLAWLSIAAGYATMVALTTGISFTPLSASRKVLLLVLAAPAAGLAVDFVAGKARWVTGVLSLGAAVAALWSFSTVFVQREAGLAVAAAALVAVCAAGIVWLTVRLRGDGVATGAAGLGLGIATGGAALLSASSGYLMSGIAIAAASGAMLLIQVAGRRAVPPGVIGTLSIGLAAALIASATLMIAQLPWYALPLMLLVPLSASLAAGSRLPLLARAALCAAASLVAAVPPLLAAWVATLGAP